MDDRKEDEIELDFSKVKNFFSKFFANKDKSSPNPESDVKIDQESKEDISIDFTKVTGFIKNHSTLFVLILLIVLQFLPNYGLLPWGGVYMRLINQDLPKIDDAVRENIYALYKNQIMDAVNRQSPNLPITQKDAIVEEQFQTILKQNQGLLEQQIAQKSNELKEHYRYEFNGAKYTYMPDIDPYLYLRYADNFLKKGTIADEIKDGKLIDNHQFAPLGNQLTDKSIHPYVLAYMHKFFSLFNSRLNLMQSATYFPIVLILLSLIPAFFIAQRMTNNLGGFVAATILMVHIGIISRTLWGHADTDMYNIFFPLLILWIFIESIMANSTRNKYLLTTLLSFIISIYSLAWNGWWFIFDFMLATIGIFIGVLIIKNILSHKNILTDKTLKETFVFLFFLLITSGVFISLLNDYQEYINAIQGPFKFKVIKDAAKSNLWPNVYTTVAELNPVSFNNVVYNQFGIWYILLAFLGIFIQPIKELFYYLKKREFDKVHLLYSILLVIWFISTLYASTKGVRFTMLLVPAFAISIGLLFGSLYNLINYVSRLMNIKAVFVKTPLIFISLLIIIPMSAVSYQVALQDLPIVNDAWWSVLTKIKQNSSQNAIVTSWWDFGHHFKYISDRAVTFDGGSQNKPMAHWVGKLFLTNNEKQSIGILRMLNCGSNTAFNELNKEVNNTVKTVNILNDIILLDKEEARTYLFNTGIKNVETIINLTHCDPPESFVIVSGDMVSKSGVWAHFGSWDFKKAELWLNFRGKPREEVVNHLINNYNFSNTKAEDYYSKMQNVFDEDEANKWIAPWPSFFAINTARCIKDKETLKCQNGFTLGNDGPKIVGEKQLHSVIYISEDKKYKINLVDESKQISSVLIPNEDEMSNILAWPEIASSIFTRLYFLEGQGLKYFKLFAKDRQLSGENIYVWKIDWTGNQNNIMSSLIEKEKVDEGSKVNINFIGWLDNGTIFDSSIINWQNLNVSKDVDFNKLSTNSQKIEIDQQSLQSDIYNALINHKKGDEVLIRIDSNASLFPEEIKKQFENQSFNLKIRIERIS